MDLRATVLVTVACFVTCGDGDDGPDAGLASCADYCTAIEMHCTGSHDQYTSPEQCMQACAAFEVGAAGADAGNHLQCRAFHANAALSDPETHCVHAGPGGGAVCGTNCDGLCTLVLHGCTGANEAYPSEAECEAACGALDDSEIYDVGDVSGDTVACRLYHASVALADPATHCPHTRPDSATCR